ncbi:biotin synthase BioB [Megalodesulfovibrio gigas]|uniref:Biotin synthase n=1 Tax=Megalodesulfovibrio gigas (strain ATCC 19364 / DSM 1382 / NCIMB 9332 / VKM B-1759) TaxID=1121448 RepID=T2GAG9_MEGG1|nr:biotin synthase BioB [Megalodesulfovibrio gigas]AGW13288.1 putative biotin synthetase [Megalodesulfovibrio gigas DSM 1382 = ATCC 19364]
MIIFPKDDRTADGLADLARQWLAKPWEEAAVLLLDAIPQQPEAVLALAGAVARLTRPLEISRCAIVSVRTGACSEDCAFCAQSAHHGADSPAHDFLDAETIAAAACRAREAGATRLGLVAAGRGFDPRELPAWQAGVRAVVQAGLACDVSPGIIDEAALRALREAGASMLHHNLEAARSFFPSLCTTHTWDDRARTIRAGHAAGLAVCAGGIFGLGESWAQRIELALALRELVVQSVPLNFLHPIPGTPMAHRPTLGKDEAAMIVACFRLLLPDAALRLCGGRHLCFPDVAARVQALEVGADGIMVGDFLTTSGSAAELDVQAAILADRRFDKRFYRRFGNFHPLGSA